ncbi:MAG: hypothetical protein JWN30_1474 [Bacilli bacterium]|nr:hypothetical protein [Bacilli bacterium]
MHGLSRTALTLVIIGAINWLLVGLFQWDLIAAICGGSNSFVSRVIYTIIGLAGIYCITLFFANDDRARRSS